MAACLLAQAAINFSLKGRLSRAGDKSALISCTEKKKKNNLRETDPRNDVSTLLTCYERYRGLDSWKNDFVPIGK